MLCNEFRRKYDGIKVATNKRDCATQEKIRTFSHNHSEIEILHIIKGNATVYINNIPFKVAEGDTVFISPYDMHHTEIPEGVFYSSRCICFDAEELQNAPLKLDLENGSSTIIPIMHSAALSESVLKIYALCNDKPQAWQMEVRALLLLMFAEFERNGTIQHNATANKDNLFCKRVLAFLEQHYAEKITSATIAAKMFFSQEHFCRMFKANFGENFSGFLCRFRLEHSLALLKDNSLSVSQVASLSGFDNPSYYTKLFHKTFNLTPKQYRNKITQG